MRHDMAKLIVERPRGMCGYSRMAGDRRQLQRVPVEEWPLRQSIRIRDKYLNENLAPLIRFLEKQVGRPWNKVRSEMCEHMDFSNAVQAHIWQHVIQYVCIHPMVVRGELLTPKGRPLSNECVRLYVDPATGLLRRAKRSPRTPARNHWQRPRDADFPTVALSEGAYAVQLAGVWYRVELAAWPSEPGKEYDVVRRKPIVELKPSDGWWLDDYGYAVRKRQLNSREIERLVRPRRDRPLPSFVRNRRRRRRG